MSTEDRDNVTDEFSTAFAEAAAARAPDPDPDQELDERSPAEEEGDLEGDAPPREEQQTQAEDVWAQAPEPARRAYEAAVAEQEKLRHAALSNAGRVSALQRKVNELESSQPARPSAAEAPTVQPSAQEIEDAMQTPETWASFSEEYPEVAKAVDSRISREVARLEQSLSPLRQQIERQQKAEAEQNQRYQEETLSKAHPQWKQTIQTPEFHQWFEGQPASIQALSESDYADDAIALLNFYSGTRREGGAPAASGRVSELHAARQRRLESSIENPGRRAGQRPLDEDDFSSAFKAAAAKKMRGIN